MTEQILKKSRINEQNTSITGTKIILALQHLIAMFGATVLVPILTGFNPSVAIFTAGCGTLIFHICTKGKVPVFLGSSFAFIPVILTVSNLYNGDLSYAQGGIVIAGLLYCILSLVVYKVGVGIIKRLLPPQVVGPMIIVIGMNLLPTAIEMASSSFLLAGITLALALIVRFKGRGISSQLSIIIAIAIGYIVALLTNNVDLSVISSASLISVPSFQAPKFDFGAIAIIAPVTLAIFMEHVGDITTNGQVTGENYIEDPGLHRTLLGDGIATMFAGFVGGPANTTYGENTGVLAITKNYDPFILRLAAIFAIILAFVGKLGGVLASVPSSVMGGISIMLFSMISIIGVQTIKNEKVKFNGKNVIIMVTIMVLGLGSGYLSELLDVTIGINLGQNVSITGLSFAAIVGIFLNLILNRK